MPTTEFSTPVKFNHTDTNELVEIIAGRYDDSEQAEALMELLKRTGGGVEGEDVAHLASQHAYTFTDDFREAVDAVMNPQPAPAVPATALKCSEVLRLAA